MVVGSIPTGVTNYRKKQAMYSVIFKRDYGGGKKDRVVLAANLPTLESAKVARKLSGDLVVDSKTFKTITNTEWLWDWEKNKSNCYAMQEIRWEKARNGNQQAIKELAEKGLCVPQ